MKTFINLTLSFISILAFAASIKAQAPSSFKYQGVVRDADGQIMKDAEIALKLSIFVEGSFTAYSEEFVDLRTNKAGVFSVNVGAGDFIMGVAPTVEEIDWSANNYSLMVELDTDLADGNEDYAIMGISPILSVPYALHAKSVDNADDADADPENELQNLSYDPTTNRLEISDGNFVNVNEFLDDFEDADNQTLSIVNTTLEISGGNQIELGHLQDGVNDADADPSNEIQTLNLAGNVLSLVNISGEIQNSVTLNPGQSGNVSWNDINNVPTSILDGDDVEDADADPLNEMQSLNLDGDEIQLLDANGNVFSAIEFPEGNVPLSSWGALTGIPADLLDGDQVDDADADASNEIQTLVYAGTTLELVNADGSVESSVEIAGGTDADADPNNEIQFLELDGTTLRLVDGAGAEQSSINLPTGGSGGSNDWNDLNNIPSDLQDGDQVDDADADPSNEIQNLSFDPVTSQLSIENGNSISIPTGGTDADADPSNEFNTDVRLNGTALVITDGGGDQTVDLNALVNDADADPENEKQTLEIDEATGVITLINADGTVQSSVQVPAGPGGSGDGDNDATNELQDWSNLPGIPADLLDGDQVDDADSDPMNELQDWTSLPGIPADILDGDQVDDADSDPENEKQTLEIDEATGVITLINADGTVQSSVQVPAGPGGSGDGDNDATNELQDWATLPGIPADLLDGDQVDDADSDPMNELQDWASLPGIPTDILDGDQVDDADADAENEFQTLNYDGTNISLTDADGNDYGTFAISSGTDADADPNNEIQDISTNGSAGNISLTSGSEININVEDGDADATNELQDWASLPGIPADLLDGDQVNDADSDDTNELQAIFLNGNQLELLDPDGSVNSSVTIAAGTDSQDLNVSGDNLQITNGVGVSLDEVNYWERNGASILTHDNMAQLVDGNFGDYLELDGNGLRFFDGFSPGSGPRIDIGFQGIDVQLDSGEGVNIVPTSIAMNGLDGNVDVSIDKDEIALRRPSSGSGGLTNFGASGVLKPNELFLGSGGTIITGSSARLSSFELVLSSFGPFGSSGLSLINSGEVRRPASGDADMLVKSYATVNPGASLESSSGNINVSNSAVGEYDVSINNSTSESFTVSVTPKPWITGGVANACMANWDISSPGVIRVYTFDLNGNPVNSGFSIIIMEN